MRRGGSSQDRPLSLLVEVLPRSASCLFRATVVLPLWFVLRVVWLGWVLVRFSQDDFWRFWWRFSPELALSVKVLCPWPYAWLPRWPACLVSRFQVSRPRWRDLCVRVARMVCFIFCALRALADSGLVNAVGEEEGRAWCRAVVDLAWSEEEVANRRKGPLVGSFFVKGRDFLCPLPFGWIGSPRGFVDRFTTFPMLPSPVCACVWFVGDPEIEDPVGLPPCWCRDRRVHRDISRGVAPVGRDLIAAHLAVAIRVTIAT
ncbi:hypothetical protein Taro_028491 [Colocasia esculenta]|uniref:Uncharacterized protein n=1 Tax=Colocasia esculenta TaxID=4460 RepID=A0A843VGL3_COLES|nr:hypothetical protein [Colocasia esculenta]